MKNELTLAFEALSIRMAMLRQWDHQNNTINFNNFPAYDLRMVYPALMMQWHLNLNDQEYTKYEQKGDQGKSERLNRENKIASLGRDKNGRILNKNGLFQRKLLSDKIILAELNELQENYPSATLGILQKSTLNELNENVLKLIDKHSKAKATTNNKDLITDLTENEIADIERKACEFILFLIPINLSIQVLGNQNELANSKKSDALKQTIRTEITTLILNNVNDSRQFIKKGRLQSRPVFQNCDFRDINLSKENLASAKKNARSDCFVEKGTEDALRDLSNIDFTGTNFEGAILEGVNFQGANLTGVNFKGADLTNADFTGAITNGAIFTDAITTNAKFDPAPPKPNTPQINTHTETIKSSESFKDIPKQNHTRESPPIKIENLNSKKLVSLETAIQSGNYTEQKQIISQISQEGRRYNYNSEQIIGNKKYITWDYPTPSAQNQKRQIVYIIDQTTGKMDIKFGRDAKALVLLNPDAQRNLSASVVNINKGQISVSDKSNRISTIEPLGRGISMQSRSR